jgi:hypothetical protein
VHPNGRRLHPVTHTRAGTGKWQSCAFSPDGRYLVSSLTPIVVGEQQNADVYVMRLNGGQPLPERYEHQTLLGERTRLGRRSCVAMPVGMLREAER